MISVPPFASEDRKEKICCIPVPLEGVTEMAEGALFAVTTVAPASCTRLPLVPLMMNAIVPGAVPLGMFKVNCVEPAPATVVGLKLLVKPAGNPERSNVSVPLKPLY